MLETGVEIKMYLLESVNADEQTRENNVAHASIDEYAVKTLCTV